MTLEYGDGRGVMRGRRWWEPESCSSRCGCGVLLGLGGHSEAAKDSDLVHINFQGAILAAFRVSDLQF